MEKPTDNSNFPALSEESQKTLHIEGHIAPPIRIGDRWRKTHKNPISWSKIIREIKRPFAQLYAPIDIVFNRSHRLKQAEKEFPMVLSLNETVDLLIGGASICRFGDGEFNCLQWQYSTDLAAKTFALRLEEVLATPSSEQLIIAIPPFDPQYNNPYKYGWLTFWEHYWSRQWGFLREKLMSRSFGNSFVSRDSVFHEVDVEKIRSIWVDRDVVFVVGKNGRFYDDPRLFSSMRSVEYLFVEPKDAWRHYEATLEKALTFDKSKLFVICAGYMATVLAFDLHRHGYQALDMGHLPNCYAEYLKEAPRPEWLDHTIVRKTERHLRVPANHHHPMSPKISLIIATYNQPEFLRLAILSAWEQTHLPDEIIIADDGSREETAELIREMKKESSVPIIHTWQPDDGYRLAMTRNNAAAVATGEYLIFLDGDCYLNKYFIEDHFSCAEKGYFVCGRRVNIRAKRKEYILRTGNRNITFFSWGTGKKFHAIRSHWLAKLHLEGGLLYKKGGMAGANFAVWREDYAKVNGCNERFVGHCGEDAELACRLDDAGIRMKKMVHLGIAYHFDHPLTNNIRWDDKTGGVHKLMTQAREEEKGRCRVGLNRAIEEGVTVLR